MTNTALGPDGITRFMVLCGPRTGSNMLTSALHSHPRIVCFREIFNFTFSDIDYNVDGYERSSVDDLALRQDDPAAFMRKRIFAQDPASVDAAGFKFIYEHFWGFDGLLEALQADAGLRIIHLKRRNGVRAFLSYKMASTTGKWQRRKGHLKRGMQASLRALVRDLQGRLQLTGGATRVALAPEECLEYIELREKQASHYDGLFQAHPSLEVTYEDMVADRRREFGRVQGFLGVEPATLVESVERQNPESLRALVSNYEELAAALRQTPHAWMLDEPDPATTGRTPAR